MKKLCVFLGVSLTVWLTPLSADALKNSLTNMLNEKESSSMVDLGNINLNGKANPSFNKPRLGNTVIGTVNKHTIRKKQADNYLKERTQGKISNYDNLPPEQQQRLIYELSLPLLISDIAKKELSALEKQTAYTRTWMKKEALKTTITDEEALKAYDEITKQAKENNVTTSSIPPFESIKEKIKLQMIEKEIVGKLMKDIKIKVL